MKYLDATRWNDVLSRALTWFSQVFPGGRHPVAERGGLHRTGWPSDRSPSHERRGSRLSLLSTPAEDLRGGPLERDNRRRAPLLDAHLVSDESQTLIMCK